MHIAITYLGVLIPLEGSLKLSFQETVHGYPEAYTFGEARAVHGQVGVPE